VFVQKGSGVARGRSYRAERDPDRSPTAAARVRNDLRPRARLSGMVENVVYPAYFDAERSRSEGRRVPADLAIDDPTVDEIAKAVQQVGYDAVIERDKTYSREFEARGAVVVQGTEDTAKNDLVQAVAAYLGVIRE
jgi:signal recognition particle subunit SRP19